MRFVSGIRILALDELKRIHGLRRKGVAGDERVAAPEFLAQLSIGEIGVDVLGAVRIERPRRHVGAVGSHIRIGVDEPQHHGADHRGSGERHAFARQKD